MKVKADPVRTKLGASECLIDPRKSANLHSNGGMRHIRRFRKRPEAELPEAESQETPNFSNVALNLFSGLTPTKRSTSLPF